MFVNCGDISTYCVIGGERAVAVGLGLTFTFRTKFIVPKILSNLKGSTFVLSGPHPSRRRAVRSFLAASRRGSAEVVLYLLLNHNFLGVGGLHLVRGDYKVLLFEMTNVGW